MKHLLFVLMTAFSLSASAAKPQTVTLHILETSDVHGCFFPWDFINKRAMNGSLARVSTYVNQKRNENPDGVILLENGDILQGQPINYYYNYLSTQKPNIASQCVNFMKYDAQNWGNHDVETGHACYDKWDAELQCPVLGANVIDTKSGNPYLKPYTIIERQGVRVAVIGILTPAIPSWLSENLWHGLRFQNMVDCARQWVEYVKKNERPDVIIGLFHAGKEGGIVTANYKENESMEVARTVPGFDIVMFGHDHSRFMEKITNTAGESVLVLNPGNNAQTVSEAIVTISKKGKRVVSKEVKGNLVDVRTIDTDKAFMEHFKKEIDDVNAWATRKIGTIEQTISTRDCFFGSSAFTDLIHNLQLQITNADISFTAPLTFNAELKSGDITVADMFKLYKFENQLYTMKLTGKEILGALEMSYDLWVNTMQSPDDHIMQIDYRTRDNNEKAGFRNMTFNFDSAAGIDYVVDVTKPDGQKVKILNMSNGEPFDLNKTYIVAVNSYRGNGGGELLTKGAGLSHDELDKRIISRTDRDQRWYLTQEIERLGIIAPKPNNNWRFVPDEWAIPALARDRKLIFQE